MAISNDESIMGILSEHADLPLSDDRRDPVAQILFAWLQDANALSRKMSAPMYTELTPIIGILQTVYQGELAK
jgi:hypothetical protein